MTKIFEEAIGGRYEGFFRQIGEILMGMGIIVEGLGSSQAENIALLNSKHNQLMQDLIKGIASVGFEEASKLIVLVGLSMNIKRAVEALDALSFLFEGKEEPIESQRKRVNEAIEIFMNAFSNLETRRETELDEVLSRFKLLKTTLGGIERIRNNPISILVYKLAYNGYCAARVARGLA
ncbi:MAG: hypothetical protein ACUVQY_07075 [Thermoproteota archaeon]